MEKDVEEFMPIGEQQQVPIGFDDMSKTIRAFLEDSRVETFEEVLQNFFSKHVLLSFLDDRDIGIMMLQFDNVLNNYMVSKDFDWKDITKIEQLRMLFFAALKRAKGKGDNERSYLAKNISESIVTSNQQQQQRTGVKRWLFG